MRDKRVKLTSPFYSFLFVGLTYPFLLMRAAIPMHIHVNLGPIVFVEKGQALVGTTSVSYAYYHHSVADIGRVGMVHPSTPVIRKEIADELKEEGNSLNKEDRPLGLNEMK